MRSERRPGAAVLEHAKLHGQITSATAGALYLGSAARLLPAAVVTTFGRTRCLELRAAGMLAAGAQPDTWTLPKGTSS